MTPTDELTFEQALVQLEEIVEKLDAGDLPLEQSIELFEQGMKLKDLCLRKLDEAQAVVEQYTESTVAASTDAAIDDPFQEEKM